jgi:DegV family protein with EDD domain
MREIIISTESGSDLPESLAEKYGIKVTPMHIVMESTDYHDGSISVDQIYEYYNETKKIPSTSAVNVGEYIDFFTQIRKEHPDCVIMHLAYSSLASCTYQNAEIAIREFPDIYLIDTKNVSGGCTAHLAKAYEIIQAKKDTVTDYQALADEIQTWADKVFCSFIPGNLDYLKAGGRVSNAQYLGATLLRLKPLIEIVNGQLVASKKYRGSIEKFVDLYMEDYLAKHNVSRDCLYLMYSKGLSQVALDRMKENAIRFGFKSYEYVMTGCVISCHSGPGAIGLAGCCE